MTNTTDTAAAIAAHEAAAAAQERAAHEAGSTEYRAAAAAAAALRGDSPDPLEFPTREAAQAAADADLSARREADPAYAGERFVMALADAGPAGRLWVHADDTGPDERIVAWGVSDGTGEQMLGTDGSWWFVA